MRRTALSFGIIGTLLGGAPASAQLSSLPPAQVPVALDVPYLPQSTLLCGGAAVAMVERYWGKRQVYAEEFASLVRPDEGGIRTEELAGAARGRGWETRAFDGTTGEVQRLLSQGVPVVALIEVAPKRYHYVVLLEWREGRVRYHDPAIAPNRVVDETEFTRAWQRGAWWAMTLKPATAPVQPTVPASADSVPRGAMPCSPYLDAGLDAAAAGQLDSAVTLLIAGQRACPNEPLVQRELAAVRFRQRRYDQSVILAESYTANAPNDSLGWRLLAASQYLTHDPEAGLTAWNRVGEPRVDLVRVDGLRRVRYRVATSAMDIEHGALLTQDQLRLAHRRLDAVPGLYRSRVGYIPVAGGLAEVRATVAERPLLEPWVPLVAGNAVRAIAREEVALELGALTGAGERAVIEWRWAHAHPRLGIELAVPAAIGLPGVLAVQGVWERYRYKIGGTSAEETRRAGGIELGSWVTAAFHPTVGLRYDRWSGDRQYLAVSVGTEVRLADDRLTLRAAGEAGPALKQHEGYTRGRVSGRWASSSLLHRSAWSVRAGLDRSTASTPSGLWAQATGDVPEAIPLRAHPYIDDDLLPSGTIARTAWHGGAALDKPFYRTPLITLAAGLFVDGVVLDQRLNGGGRRTLVDGGGGLRIGLADGALGLIRIDLATGLNDDATALTVGMHREWPL